MAKTATRRKVPAANKANELAVASGGTRRVEESKNDQTTIPPFINNFIRNIESFEQSLPIIMNIQRVILKESRSRANNIISNGKSEQDEAKDFSDKEWAKVIENMSIQEKTDYFSHNRDAIRSANSYNRLPMIILTSLVGEFEVLIAEIFKWAYSKEPRLFGSIKKEVSVSEVAPFAVWTNYARSLLTKKSTTYFDNLR